MVGTNAKRPNGQAGIHCSYSSALSVCECVGAKYDIKHSFSLFVGKNVHSIFSLFLHFSYIGYIRRFDKFHGKLVYFSVWLC